MNKSLIRIHEPIISCYTYYIWQSLVLAVYGSVGPDGLDWKLISVGLGWRILEN